MKTKIIFAVAAATLCTLMSSCVKEYREGTSMRIDDNSDREVTVGDTVFLKAIISPADESSTVVWGTTNENVAKVVVQRLVEGKADRYVMVLANAPGETKVYVTVNGTMSDTCKIKVNGPQADPAKVTLSDSVLVIEKGYSDTLAYTLEPEGAEASSVVWSVRDGKIAAVSQDGVVVALDNGLTWVYVKIDDKITDSCQVWAGVVYPEAPELPCVKIAGTWWASVNCGYDAVNYKYGKLYQWGRKTGGGYDAKWTEGGSQKGPEAVIQTAISGPVSESSENASNFYTSSGPDWLTPQDSTRWNSNKTWPGKETSPTKTNFDPCPAGWRVPTYAELDALTGNGGTESIGSAGWDSANKGYWFNGTKSPKSGEGLFLPAAGERTCDNGSATGRDSDLIFGVYWSSSVIDYEEEGYAYRLLFNEHDAYIEDTSRASGFSVRCVQE